LKRAISLPLLCKLWAEYAEFKKPQLAPSTYHRDYQKIARRLEKMRLEAPFLQTSIEIRDWLLRHYAAETSRKTIQQFNACGRWAMESDLLKSNPFDGLQRHIRPKRASDKAWAAFTVQERDRIIHEFDAFYLSQYHCRHTWITEALNHLSVQDVSYLARVSPHVLYKHYAGRSRRILIPEF
jgi:integrase